MKSHKNLTRLFRSSVQYRRFTTSGKPDLTLKESIRIVKEREERKAQFRKNNFQKATEHLPSFETTLKKHSKYPLKREIPTIFQINIGKICNLTCRHCHVESGPTKTLENMDEKTVERCLHIIKNSPSIKTVDITGGAPEMNPYFRYVVEESRKLGKQVMDRCNLVILLDEEFEGDGLAEFLAKNKVTVVASLPCYTLQNVENQRGRGVFDSSILALKKLNSLGYGQEKDLELHLVYNPGGPALPAPQKSLEQDYKRELKNNFGIVFNNLFTITNMPIKRFADDLYKQNKYVDYMEMLVNNFSPNTVDGLMCRNTINIQWDGKLYDCDFNGALEIGMKTPLTIWDIESTEDLKDLEIAIDKHCYGCTAGFGSSCTGAISQ